MKKIILVAFATIAVMFASCGSNLENTPSSTPVDSTNLYGDAPVKYGPIDPANPDSPKTQGAYDTGMRANTMNTEDSIRKGIK